MEGTETERLLGNYRYQTVPTEPYGTSIHPITTLQSQRNVPCHVTSKSSQQNTKELADAHREAFSANMYNYSLTSPNEIDWGDVQDLHDIDLHLRKHGPTALPGLGWRGTVAILLAVGAAIAGFVFYLAAPSKDMICDHVKVYLWLFWITILLVSLVLVDAITSLLDSIIIKYTWSFYWVKGLALTIMICAWGIANFYTFELILGTNHHCDGTYFLLNRFFLGVIILSAARTVFIAITQIFMTQHLLRRFSPKILHLMYKESLVSKLLPPNLRKMTPPYYPSNSYLWSYVKQPQWKINDDIASQVYHFLDRDSKGYITLNDVFFRLGSAVHAKKAFELFDRDENKKIDLAEVKYTLKQIAQQRTDIANSIINSEDIASILKNLLEVLFWLVTLLSLAQIYGASLQRFVIPFGTFLIAFAFIFGNSLKNAWESALFVFGTHAFDVGDRIALDKYGELIVKKINLTSTEFFSPDGRLYLIPNNDLYGWTILQHRRSPFFAVRTVFEIGFHTSQEQLLELERRVKEWVSNPENGDWDLDSWKFYVKEIESLNKMKLLISIRAKDINWQNADIHHYLQSDLLLATAEACKQLNITYHLPSLDISLRKKQD